MSSSSEEDQSSASRHRSSKPSRAQPSGALSDQDQPQHDPNPPYYREVALSDVPSILKRWTPSGAFFLSLIPWSLCLGPQLQLWVWMMKKAVKSSDLEVLPLCYHSAQFEHDFQAANLPEGKYIKPPPSTTKWYKVSPVMRRKS